MGDAREPLTCAGLRAAYPGLPECCRWCHREAERDERGRDGFPFAPLAVGALLDGRRFACCCEVLFGLLARGLAVAWEEGGR